MKPILSFEELVQFYISTYGDNMLKIIRLVMNSMYLHDVNKHDNYYAYNGLEYYLDQKHAHAIIADPKQKYYKAICGEEINKGFKLVNRCKQHELKWRYVNAEITCRPLTGINYQEFITLI